MQVEGDKKWETSVALKVFGSDYPVNAISSITHPSLPLSVVAFAGISTEIQFMIRCESFFRNSLTRKGDHHYLFHLLSYLLQNLFVVCFWSTTRTRATTIIGGSQFTQVGKTPWFTNIIYVSNLTSLLITQGLKFCETEISCETGSHSIFGKVEDKLQQTHVSHVRALFLYKAEGVESLFSCSNGNTKLAIPNLIDGTVKEWCTVNRICRDTFLGHSNDVMTVLGSVWGDVCIEVIVFDCLGLSPG